jgi:ATP-dependent Lon protease
MATALVSALSGRKIRRDVAMTGELTLTGRVLPIGGLKEKILGAIRAGIDEIIMPCDNEADLDDLQDEVRKSLTIHLVEDLDQVIGIALKSEKAKTSKKKKTAKRKPRAKASPSQTPASA